MAILAGAGALRATDELLAVAEMLGAPIAKALLGKAAVPDDSPFTTGQIGLLGTRASQEAMEACDTLLLVGTSFPYIEFLPKPGKAKGVQIDIDPARIGLRFPVDVGLVGDARRSLRALLPLLRRKSDRSFLEKAQQIDPKNAATYPAADVALESIGDLMGCDLDALRGVSRPRSGMTEIAP